ncbi:feruloyl esterase, partial [Streptomyces sp. NPDC002586]
MPLPMFRKAPGAPPRARSLPRFLPRLLAVVAVVLGTALAGPLPAARASVALTEVSGFGSNPGALTMYVYRPASLPAHP